MSVVTEEMLILVRDAISKANACDGMRGFCKRYGPGACSCMHMAEAALAAVAPLIAAQERERAAAMVETSIYIMSGSKPSHLEYDPKRAKTDNHHATIAAAIRALGDVT